MALTLQDYTTFILGGADSGVITSITADRIDYTAFPRGEVYMTKDFGAGNVSLEELNFQLFSQNTGNGSGAIVWLIGAADAIGAAQTLPPPRFIFNNNPDASNVDRFVSALVTVTGTWFDIGARISRKERLVVGTVSGKTYTQIIYAQNTVGAIDDTLSFTATGVIPSVKYLYGINSQGTSGQTINGWQSTLLVDGLPVSVSSIPPHVFQPGVGL